MLEFVLKCDTYVSDTAVANTKLQIYCIKLYHFVGFQKNWKYKVWKMVAKSPSKVQDDENSLFYTANKIELMHQRPPPPFLGAKNVSSC